MFRGAARSWAALILGVVLFAQPAFATATLAVRRSSGETSSVGLACGLAAIGLIAFGIGFAIYSNKVRSRKIEAFARSLGFIYRRKATEADASLPLGCHIAEEGYGRVVSNVLEAVQTPELAFTLFDYKYITRYGRTSSTNLQTITRMQSQLLRLPAFLLFPETIFSRLGSKILGGTDFNFEDSPVFSKSFILRGDDEPAIRALFTPAVRQALTSFPRLTIEGKGDRLFIFRACYRLTPEEISSTIEENKRILALFFEAQRASPT